MRRALTGSIAIHTVVIAAAMLARCRARDDGARAPVAIELFTPVVTPPAPAPAPAPTAAPGPVGPAAHVAARGSSARRGAPAGAAERGSVIGSMEVEARGGGRTGGGDGDGGGGGGGGLGQEAPPTFTHELPAPPVAHLAPPPPKSKARPARLIYPKRERDEVDGQVFDATLSIDAEGYVVGVHVESGPGGRRGEVGANEVWRFRYDPARDDAGQPIASRVDQHFMLDD